MNPRARTQISASKSDLALVTHQGETNRQVPDRMFEAFAKEQQVRSAKAIVLIATQRRIAVDVRAAQCRLKIKRNLVSAGGHRQRSKKSEPDTSFIISHIRLWAFGMSYGVKRAVVGAVVNSGFDQPGGFAIQGELVAEVDGEALERKVAGRKVLLISHAVIQTYDVVGQN